MTELAPHCPTCSQAGTPVDRITLKALLTPDGLRRGIPAQPRYCPTTECPIVYFDADGDVTSTESDLVVRVYAKHPFDPDMPVCYCFAVNVGSMCAERARELREMVAHEVQAHRCACEVKNPKGGCCLGDEILIQIAAVKAALNQTAASLIDSEMRACVNTCMGGSDDERLDRVTKALAAVLKSS